MTKAPTRTVVLAVSGHGYGHAVRCAEVARELLDRGARVLLRSEAPSWLFPEGVELVESPGCPIDIGVVQHDGLELDVDATRECWRAFANTFDERVAREADLLEAARADVLLADVPPLALSAARTAGIPGIAMTNFSWDWIYAAWPDFLSIVEHIRRAYRQSDLLLRLPLHSTSADAFAAFRRIKDVPMVARRAQQARAVIREQLGVSNTATLVLLSFGGFDARGLDLDALAKARRYTFVLTPPLSESITSEADNLRRLDMQPVDYVSLLAACDAVVTKPGYGIVADCLANRVPILYTDRGPFREYDVLVDAMHRLGCARYIPRHDVLEGRLAPHLDALLDTPCSWTDLRLDGASVVAEHVLHA
jgi:UDP:flavonoid glycosyltransferase YjiC (YdhE family)